MMFLLLVTVISMLLAVIMSVIAWRVAHEERRRSAARVAALASEIDDPDLTLRRVPATPVPGAALFETGSAVRTGPRLATVVGIGVLVCGSLAALAVVAGSGSHASAANPTTLESPANTENLATRPNRDTPVPLELLALGHERAGDRLAVRGVVRNPSAGREVDRLTAVVFLYSRDGVFLTSGRAAIESTALGPGGESAFVVVVPGANDVGRYRVSFRTEDRVVPHVDRRDHAQDKS
jgi:hypothetical protein